MNSKITIGVLIVLIIAITAAVSSGKDKESVVVNESNNTVSSDQAADRGEVNIESETGVEMNDNFKAEQTAEVDKKEMIDDENDEMSAEETTAAPIASLSGSYDVYSPEKVAQSEGDIVLFFHATWCPSCRTLDADISANLSTIPEGVTILKTDYDTYTDLRQKYAVRTQHSFVQVDSQGNMVHSWIGGNTLNQVLSNIK